MFAFGFGLESNSTFQILTIQICRWETDQDQVRGQRRGVGGTHKKNCIVRKLEITIASMHFSVSRSPLKKKRYAQWKLIRSLQYFVWL